ncbi:hypothetical protein K503DRAFT_170508 [Rhizopogon vinicolor AM-OR11-026]|uniref:Uncharacterized protein n=1 Tax=Rhizopogon vinicolor AM-OR11-026 TaxID=1314800 RepID=A0A1B7N0D2_9AGAM|nr:hypothetical protein K503DRAFT_170508 [Rhizopogon vinicolor AM-OR11-026]
MRSASTHIKERLLYQNASLPVLLNYRLQIPNSDITRVSIRRKVCFGFIQVMVSAPSFSRIPHMNVSIARNSNKAVPREQCNREGLINLEIKRISGKTPAFYFPGPEDGILGSRRQVFPIC